MSRGLFIGLEGGEGGGKTTLAQAIRDWMTSEGHDVLLTREPGGTALGRTLRREVLHGEDLDPVTEAMIYATDRSHHVSSLVRPALESGTTVITDRYIDSSVAYQALGRGLPEEMIRNLSRIATDGLLPDLTFILDIDPEVGLRRAAGVGPADRIERAGMEFHRSVRSAFLSFAAAAPDRYVVLDASECPSVIAEQAVSSLRSLLSME